MPKSYDEQSGFRKKTGEKDFKIRRVGGRSESAATPTSSTRDTGWTLLDQVAGKPRSEMPEERPAGFATATVGASAAVSAPPEPIPPEPVAPAGAPEPAATSQRFRSLLSGPVERSPQAVSGAYNGTPLKALLRRIAERQASHRPAGFDEWR